MILLLYSLLAVIASAWNSTLGTINGYYNLTEVNNLLEEWSKLQNKTETFTIGKSRNGNAIKAFHLNPGKGSAVLFIGLHHARELISTTQVLSLLNFILQDESDEIEYLRNNREIIFIPVLNVDGLQKISEHYDKTHTILDIRKNQRPTENCFNDDHGVDLNRNYEYMWGYDNEGSSNNSCGEDYRGTSPFSEPETVAIRDLLLNKSFVVAVSYHSWGDLYVHPYCYRNSFSPSDLRPEYWSLYSSVKSILPSTAQFGNPYTLLQYAVNGCFIDFAYSLGIFSMAVELGVDNDFHPPRNKIQGILENHLTPAVYLLKHAGPVMNMQLQNLTIHGTVVEFYLEIINEGMQDSANQTLIFELSHEYSIYHFFPYNTFAHSKNGKLTYIHFPTISKRSKQAIMFKINLDESAEEFLYNFYFQPHSPLNSHLSSSIKHKIVRGSTTVLLWIVIAIIALIGVSVVVIYRFTKKRITPIKFVELDKFNKANSQGPPTI